jgi:hypothetical protein
MILTQLQLLPALKIKPIKQCKKVYHHYKISFTALDVCVIFSCGWQAPETQKAEQKAEKARKLEVKA